MKRILAALVFGLNFFSPSFGQQSASPSGYSLAKSADILPHLGLFVSGGINFYAHRPEDFRGQIRFGLADILELGFVRQEGAVNLFGNAWEVNQWELKLRILEGTNAQPAVSVAIRSFFQWQNDGLIPQDIASLKPALWSQGFFDAQYEDMVSSGTVIVTEKPISGFQLTGGLGVQEVQTRYLWMFISPAPSQSGFNAPQLERHFMLSGFLNAQFDLQPDLALFAEGQSIPVITPNLARMALDYNSGYLATVGIRYAPMVPFSLDAMMVRQLGFESNPTTQFRIGLSSLISPPGGVSYSQWRFGIKGGMNSASVEGGGAPPQAKPITTFTFGGYCEIPFSSSFAIQPELLYTQKGYKQEFLASLNNVPTPAYDFRRTMTLSYLEIPVLLKYTFDLAIVQPSVYGGAGVAILMSAQERLERGGYENLDWTGGMAPVDPEVLFGASLCVSIVRFDFRYSHGLVSIPRNEWGGFNKVWSVMAEVALN